MDIDFEDILLDVGDSGTYQKRLIMFFLIPTTIMFPWFTMNTMFMISDPDHWCYVPEVATSNLTIKQQRSFISPPENPKCRMYNISYKDYLDAGIYIVPNDSATMSCNTGWQYDKTDYESTAVTQYNMVCDYDHYGSFVYSMRSLGSIIGTPFYGSLSDKIGRRITFFIVLAITAITEIASVLWINFTAFLIFKSINGALYPTVFQNPYIIVLELIAPEMRTHMNGLDNVFWAVGACILPLMAWLCRTWVTLGLLSAAVCVSFFSFWKYLPESPRWLVSQGKYQEASLILRNIAKKNGKVVDPKVLLSKLQTLGDKVKNEKVTVGVENNLLGFLKYPQLRKYFLIITCCWVANSSTFYGLQLNVYHIDGNEFFNFFLTTIVEIPGYLLSWIVMDKFGRRWPAAVAFLVSGITCLLPAFVTSLPYAEIICSMIGKFCASGTFMITYQQSSELYPTVVRSLGMGTSSTIAEVACLGVPYLIYLGSYNKSLPFIVLGFSSIFAGILAAFLPETLNENLPQTISDTEKFGRRRKFFSYNRRKQSICRERAASIAFQTRGFQETDKEKDIKA